MTNRIACSSCFSSDFGRFCPCSLARASIRSQSMLLNNQTPNPTIATTCRMSSTPSIRVCRYNASLPDSVTSLDHTLADRITSCVSSRTSCPILGSRKLEPVQARRVRTQHVLTGDFGHDEV
jgi:hypothetical protein